ncbi:MBL fold metallo-hydrolase [Scopulibacillus cellulosilyticus]|uniref:MBL fold metallo-hydrolase n=1 Tax=Scopulibacillus cellulosilyticus TaxID=2665665 RepID=A0ABW2Q2I5_9BACL
MKPVLVDHGVWQMTLPTPFDIGPVNVYLIQNDIITLVDAGPKTEEAWLSFNDALKHIGMTPKDIDQIVLTHHHPDHTGLVNYFNQDIPVIAHSRLRPWFEQDEAFMMRYNRYFKALGYQMGVPEIYRKKMSSIEEDLKYASKGILTKAVDEGDTIDGLKDWQVLYTPGHAQSHISLYREKDGLFLAGDLLLEKISSNAILEPPYNDKETPPCSLLQYRESLKRCLKLNISKVCPGHGKVFAQAHELINERLQNQLERRNKVLSYLESGWKTTFDIGKEMFSKAYLTQMDLVLSEIQGYLDWLLQAENIQKIENNGVIYYKGLYAENTSTRTF